MRRSSSRRSGPKRAELKGSSRAGLLSLIDGNELLIARMLDIRETDAEPTLLIGKLQECMGLSDLSIEALLSRFFSKPLLATYCEKVAGLGSKGSTPVLAARIAKAWLRPSWSPLEDRPITTLKRKAGGNGNGNGNGNAAVVSSSSSSTAKRVKGTTDATGSAAAGSAAAATTTAAVDAESSGEEEFAF